MATANPLMRRRFTKRGTPHLRPSLREARRSARRRIFSAPASMVSANKGRSAIKGCGCAALAVGCGDSFDVPISIGEEKNLRNHRGGRQLRRWRSAIAAAPANNKAATSGSGMLSMVSKGLLDSVALSAEPTEKYRYAVEILP